MSPMAKQTHHKHTSRKDYRRLLDTLAEWPNLAIARRILQLVDKPIPC